jgi:hypothetical protein
VAEIYECFDTDTNHLGHLTKLKQYGIVEDFIASFEHLAFQTEGMSDAFFYECFVNGLKDDIHAHVLMYRPQSWVEATKRDKEAQQVVSSQNKKPSFISRTKLFNPTTPSAPLKIQKLTRDKMDECQLNGLCYNCDEKKFWATSVRNKIFLWPSRRISQKRMLKLPLCLSHLKPLT